MTISINPVTATHLKSLLDFKALCKNPDYHHVGTNELAAVCDCCQEVKSHVLIQNLVGSISVVYCTDCNYEINKYLIVDHKKLIAHIGVLKAIIISQEKALTMSVKELTDFHLDFLDNALILMKIVEDFKQQKQKFIAIPTFD